MLARVTPAAYSILVGLLVATWGASPALGYDCRREKEKKPMDSYECQLNSFQGDYSEAIGRSKQWILKHGSKADLKTIKVKLNHWDRSHLQAALSRSTRVLHLVDNGVAVHVDDLLVAKDLEELVLNGTDLIGVTKLAKLAKVRLLGFAVTSNDTYDFASTLASLPSLQTLELYGHLLKESDAASLAKDLAGAKLKTVRFLFRPFELKPKPRAQLEAQAKKLKAKLPALTVEIVERAADEDSPDAVHDY